MPLVALLRYAASLALSPATRKQEWKEWQEFLKLKRQYGQVLSYNLHSNLHSAGRTQKRALVIGMGMLSYINVELAILKSLELAGYCPIVLLGGHHPLLTRYYRLAGAKVLHWDDFAGLIETDAAEDLLTSIESADQLLNLEYMDARVGRFAAALSLRSLRVGDLNLKSEPVRRHVSDRLLGAMRFAATSRALIQRLMPQLAVFIDRGYTPEGELFDLCLKSGVDVITYNAAHKNNQLIFKRYKPENRDVHPVSLSRESWNLLRQIVWTESHRRKLREEIYTNYASGEWYGEVATQFQKRIVPPSELRQRLGLDPARKTAAIFSHIFWDATFFWGHDLFSNYEEWFVETIRAACANQSVNWIVKVHPANVTKNIRDGVSGEPAEMTVIRNHVGVLPPHISLIPADSDINTYSLLDVIDFCLTVRGTIGIEAASFGKVVLTAGTGRYDHLGFTVDSETPEEYLERLAKISEIPQLSPAQTELAERFAYGVFLVRPFPLETVTLEYQKDAKASISSHFRAHTPEEWSNAPDLRALATWLNSGCEDFLVSDELGNSILVGG